MNAVELRKHLGWPVQICAELANVDRSTWYRWERCKVMPASFEDAKKTLKTNLLKRINTIK